MAGEVRLINGGAGEKPYGGQHTLHGTYPWFRAS
jgi:hypothetical protein